MQAQARERIWIATGAAAAAPVLLCGGCSTASIIRAALAFILCAAAAHDLEVRRIENGTVLSLVALRCWQLVLAGISGPGPLAPELASSLGGAATVLAVLLGTAWLMERRTGAAGIGGGDVKLLSALGFCLGWDAGLAITGLSSILMLLHRLVPRRLRPWRGEAYAFAPYIAIASVFTMLVL